MVLEIFVGNESYKKYDELLKTLDNNVIVVDGENIQTMRQMVLNCKQTNIIISFDSLQTRDRKHVYEIVKNVDKNKNVYIISQNSDNILTKISQQYGVRISYTGKTISNFTVFEGLFEPISVAGLNSFMDVDLRLFLLWANNSINLDVYNPTIINIIDKVNKNLDKGTMTNKLMKTYIYYNFPRNKRLLQMKPWRRKVKNDVKPEILKTIQKKYLCSKSNAQKLHNLYEELKIIDKGFRIQQFEPQRKISTRITESKVVVKKPKPKVNNMSKLDRW